MRDKSVVRFLSTQGNKEDSKRDIHAASWIRTHDPSVPMARNIAWAKRMAQNYGYGSPVFKFLYNGTEKYETHCEFTKKVS
jgi:hypothetical protein